MSRRLVPPRLSVRKKTPAKQVDPIQRSALSVKAENRDPGFVSLHSGCRTYSMTCEEKAATTIRDGHRGRTFNELESQISSPVLDPAEIVSPVQVADPSRFTRCHDRVRVTEVAHPLTAKVDGFVVGCSSRSRFRRLSHMSRVHPSSDTRSSRSRSSMHQGPVGGES